MRVEELEKFKIDKVFIQKFKEEKISKLYFLQTEAIKKGLFKGNNLVIAVPTASGKTLIATLGIIDRLSRARCKAVYIVPLIALANEKYAYYTKLFEGHFRTTISVGDLDSSDPWLADYDLIICTTEKLDSLTRHGATWIREVDLIIADEIHLLNDPSRGPTLEVLLTRLRQINPEAQILALSATISNARELADWLDADLVLSDFRPVKLYEGILFDSTIQFLKKKGYKLDGSPPEVGLTKNVLKLKKQSLFFVATRRSTESLAQRLSSTVKGFLDSPRTFCDNTKGYSQKVRGSELEKLEKVASESLNVLEVPTRQCRRLSSCLKNGVAFHHAGLLPRQKRIIEENFRNGLIKVIVATPTLAYGVNLPAFRVIVRDVKRYYKGLGSNYIPVLEYKQFIGRAGRPQYDKFGESLLIAKSQDETLELIDHFIKGEPEEIESKLALKPVLRMHTLALIASEFVRSKESLLDFFLKTFYGFQHKSRTFYQARLNEEHKKVRDKDISLIETKSLTILNELSEWGFIVEEKNKLNPVRNTTLAQDNKISNGVKATLLGRRISELYLDPLTAHHFIQCLNSTARVEVEPFSLLQAISHTAEMEPLLPIRSGDFSRLNEIVAERQDLFLEEVPATWDLEFDDFLSSVKTALMFEQWCAEATEDEILNEFKATPGELHSKLEIANWLTYSLQELSLILKAGQILNPVRNTTFTRENKISNGVSQIRKLRLRLKYGIKEELLDLVRMREIGRVRSRRLYNAGIRTVVDLKKAPQEVISRIVGPKVAQNLRINLKEHP